MFSALEITGQTRTHVVQAYTPRFAAHKLAAEAFMDMRAEALRDGFELHPFSSFRDFTSQLKIWNQKFSGKKPLYTKSGQILSPEHLTEDELIWHILGWSALPGTSRHHWGSDIDVIDAAAIAADYKVRLLPEETRAGGVFHPLHCWLDENIRRFNFFRPYKSYRGGMYPEPWQLSFAPVSLRAIHDLTPELLSALIRETPISGKQKILELVPKIFEKHILNIDQPEEFSPRFSP